MIKTLKLIMVIVVAALTVSCQKESVKPLIQDPINVVGKWDLMEQNIKVYDKKGGSKIDEFNNNFNYNSSFEINTWNFRTDNELLIFKFDTGSELEKKDYYLSIVDGSTIINIDDINVDSQFKGVKFKVISKTDDKLTVFYNVDNYKSDDEEIKNGHPPTTYRETTIVFYKSKF